MNFIKKYSNQITGYLFISPALILIFTFGIFPVFFAIYMSFHKWKVFKGKLPKNFRRYKLFLVFCFRIIIINWKLLALDRI